MSPRVYDPAPAEGGPSYDKQTETLILESRISEPLQVTGGVSEEQVILQFRFDSPTSESQCTGTILHC